MDLGALGDLGDLWEWQAEDQLDVSRVIKSSFGSHCPIRNPTSTPGSSPCWRPTAGTLPSPDTVGTAQAIGVVRVSGRWGFCSVLTLRGWCQPDVEAYATRWIPNTWWFSKRPSLLPWTLSHTEQFHYQDRSAENSSSSPQEFLVPISTHLTPGKSPPQVLCVWWHLHLSGSSIKSGALTIHLPLGPGMP